VAKYNISRYRTVAYRSGRTIMVLLLIRVVFLYVTPCSLIGTNLSVNIQQIIRHQFPLPIIDIIAMSAFVMLLLLLTLVTTTRSKTMRSTF